MDDPTQYTGWRSAGWDSEEEMFKYMISLSFEQKITWLEETHNAIASIYGEKAAFLASRSVILPKKSNVTSSK